MNLMKILYLITNVQVIQRSQLSPGPFGMLALGLICLEIQLPCSKKLQTHGEALHSHFG